MLTKTSYAFRRWNETTRLCFERKMKCNGCPEYQSCKEFGNNNNDYKMPSIKYAVLMTFANTGKENNYGNEQL